MIFKGGLSTRQPRKESVTIQLQLRDHHFEIASRVSDYFVSIPSYASCCFSFALFSLSVTVWVISNFVTVLLLELSFRRQDWKVAGKVDKSDKGTFDLTPDSVETYIILHIYHIWHHFLSFSHVLAP